MAILNRLTNVFRRSKVDREIAAELEAHIEMRTEENVAAGMPRNEARREAVLRFGNPASTRERVAAADTTLGLEDAARDVRYALRQLRRSPGFALTAIVTLALGIGANVVVFGVMNAILLRPLKVANPDRLMELEHRDVGDTSHSYPDYLDYRVRNSTFSELAAYRISDVGIGSGGTAQRGWMYEVSANYFDMLGVQPEVGRLLHSSDEHGPNSAPFVVLSDGYWRKRFNADPRVVGTVVELNKHPFTIVGVAPKTFNGTELFFWPQVWAPIVNEEQLEGYNYLTKRSNHGIMVVGMLKPGVTLDQARNDLNGVAGRMAKENPVDDDQLQLRLVKPGLMGDLLSGPTRLFLSGVMVLAGLVLVAACTNLASIFAARAADRARELAIRLSIGSTRWRILRQVLTEAVVISVAGGVAGTAVAAGLLGALSRWQPISEYPIRVTTSPDWRVYAIAFALSLASGILPGLLPARQVWRTNAMQAMKTNAANKALVRRLTFRDILLTVQIALCALLVTASLVSLRGMERSLHASFGFVPDGAVVAETDMHMAGYSDDRALPLQRRVMEETARIPGVTAVGTINPLPLSGGDNTSSVYREGTADFKPSNSVMSAHAYSISPGYLAAAETRLLAGRDITWDDGPGKPKIAIVNETFARKLVGDAPAVGRRFLEGDKSAYEIVGVIEDGKYDSLTEDPTAAMFYPLGQSPDSDTKLIVRSQLATPEIAGAVDREFAAVDSSLPVETRTWGDLLALVLFPARVATAALGVMGFLAAMLAVTGIFGMAAYSVSKRMRELGIRVALGAQRAQVMGAALARPLILLASGSVGGVVLGVLASRLLAALVYQATPRDPLVLGGAIVSMLIVGLIATWIPARRAMAVDPAKLLRDE